RGAQPYCHGDLSDRQARVMRSGHIGDSLVPGRREPVGTDAQAVAYLLFARSRSRGCSGVSTPRRMPEVAVLVYKTGRLSVGSCAVSTQGPHCLVKTLSKVVLFSLLGVKMDGRVPVRSDGLT